MTSKCFIFSSHTFRLLMKFVLICVVEEELDELNIHAARYRPEELAKLTRTTKFTRKEIQLIYRGFKQVSLGHQLALSASQSPYLSFSSSLFLVPFFS